VSVLTGARRWFRRPIQGSSGAADPDLKTHFAVVGEELIEDRMIALSDVLS
jgi:hypothetical protein